MEQFYDAVMPVVLEVVAGLLIIAFAMGLLILSTGGCRHEGKR